VTRLFSFINEFDQVSRQFGYIEEQAFITCTAWFVDQGQ